MAGLHFCTSHENWNNFGLVWLPLWWSELFLTVLIERNISTNIAHWNIHSHDLHKNVCLCDNERNLMLCMFSKQSWHGEFFSNYVISWQLTPFVVFFLKLCTPYDDTQSCNFYVSFHYRSVLSKWEFLIQMRAAYLLSPSFKPRGRWGKQGSSHFDEKLSFW